MTASAFLHHRLAGSGPGSGLESAGSEDDLGSARIERSLDALSDLVRRTAPEAGADDPAAGLLDAARDGFAALKAGADDLPPHMQVALEAIVLSDGSRPAVLIQDDRVDPTEPTLGEWQADVQGAGEMLRTIAKGTGRMTLEDQGSQRAIGTGFAIARGVIATNRHVLQAIADCSREGEWIVRPGCTIDFRGEHDRPVDSRRIFVPDRVLFSGPEVIGGTVDLSRLDLAVIALKSNGLGDLPEGLPLSTEGNPVAQGTRLAAFGFPAMPARGEVADNMLFRLFRGVFGVKRFAPGLVSTGLGGLAQDSVPSRSFGHDSSTLGGNSGSCIVALDGTWDVIGLHFGGSQQIENFAHAITRISGDFP